MLVSAWCWNCFLKCRLQPSGFNNPYRPIILVRCLQLKSKGLSAFEMLGLRGNGYCMVCAFSHPIHKVIKSQHSGARIENKPDSIPQTWFQRGGYVNAWAIREFAKINNNRSLKGNSHNYMHKIYNLWKPGTLNAFVFPETDSGDGNKKKNMQWEAALENKWRVQWKACSLYVVECLSLMLHIVVVCIPRGSPFPRRQEFLNHVYPALCQLPCCLA